MGVFTEGGFQAWDTQEWMTYIEDYEQALIGDDVDLDPTTPIGNIVQILTQLATSFDDVIQSAFWSRDIDSATGIFLTKLCAETGTIRKDATATVQDYTMFSGVEGTIIPSGSTVKQPKQYLALEDLVFTLQDDVVITATNSSSIKYSVSSVEAVTYQVTIGTASATYTASGNETIINLYNILADSINLIDGCTAVASVDGLLIETTTPKNITNQNFTTVEIGCIGTTIASIKGDITCSASTLTEIVTSGISGWYSVTNITSGINGYDIESDFILRQRQKTELNAVAGTEEAIQKSLSNLEDIGLARVDSNREDYDDAEGRPPHSVECVVSGSTNDEIAQAIYDKAPAGIGFFGRDDTSGTATKDSGAEVIVHFTRPSNIYAWVKFTRIDNKEQVLPSDYVALIQENTADYGNDNFGIGDDFVSSRMAVPFYSTEGSILTKIEIATTATPTDTPTYVEVDKIDLAFYEDSVFDATRIFVEG